MRFRRGCVIILFTSTYLKSLDLPSLIKSRTLGYAENRKSLKKNGVILKKVSYTVLLFKGTKGMNNSKSKYRFVF